MPTGPASTLAVVSMADPDWEWPVLPCAEEVSRFRYAMHGYYGDGSPYRATTIVLVSTVPGAERETRLRRAMTGFRSNGYAGSFFIVTCGPVTSLRQVFSPEQVSHIFERPDVDELRAALMSAGHSVR